MISNQICWICTKVPIALLTALSKIIIHIIKTESLGFITRCDLISFVGWTFHRILLKECSVSAISTKSHSSKLQTLNFSCSIRAYIELLNYQSFISIKKIFILFLQKKTPTNLHIFIHLRLSSPYYHRSPGSMITRIFRCHVIELHLPPKCWINTYVTSNHRR